MTLEYSVKLPPLENGDRLTRAEFERRYAAMPHLKKAELIEGIVYVASPVRVSHSQAHAEIMTWLGCYRAATSGVLVYDNPTVRLDGDNEPQPDAVLRLENGGNSRISEDGYIEGAPELVVEIAASSAAYDLHDKLRVYRRNGVQEYLVWCTYDRQIYWFSLEAGEYQPLTADAEGMIRSRQFPGLWLDPEALLAHDLGTVLRVLQAGIATPEHQAFVQIFTKT
ncbi:Uma2 family endonuclease [Thermosynechococcus sp. HN-54]|uniref:Uma2 family endonuclease n=1 Tax=Thermosynechococcus sp. HN-54 TaxID=2933959 RepID=UPI00202D027E|nr:Uma2 family endonuclease [Thermosynechococcus sp. HN-54]URR34564.1 Uma2 family endonuclease [Thermosynechococcus sp. HN-54]